MDWFKGTFTGLSPIVNGKIYGFRLQFSQQNQSNQISVDLTKNHPKQGLDDRYWQTRQDLAKKNNRYIGFIKLGYIFSIYGGYVLWIYLELDVFFQLTTGTLFLR